jgi:glycosyltransferase involved in cell wall biosynthesis
MNANPSERKVEVSVVIPCLNEKDTIEICVRKAVKAIRDSGIAGEVIVADNGSSDGSQKLAVDAGARIVGVLEKGYGNALMAGIAAADGKFIIMGDADDSYDFTDVPRFVEKLREGNDLVMGCRLPSGGGKIMPGAMPISHRLIGNPLFSFLAKHMFRAPIHDVYCGLRGFTKTEYTRLGLRCTGMEFATEMVIKSSLLKTKTAEIPITLYPDGRKSHAPHLRTFRDGWRTLRFFMLFSPKWLFLMPGAALMAMGVIGYALAMPGVRLFGATLDVHTLLFASFFFLIGYQAILFAAFAKVFAIGEGFHPMNERLARFFDVMTLEKFLVFSVTLFMTGLFFLGFSVYEWWLAGFGALDYPRTLRIVIPGVTLATLGFQSFFSSCFISILGMKRK